jgi:hypothetical protein
MARRRDFEKAKRIAKVREDNFKRSQERIFGKEPRQRDNPNAYRAKFKPKPFTLEELKKIREKKDLELENVRQRHIIEKQRKKQRHLLWLRTEGHGAKDLLFIADHTKPKNYGNMLEDNWWFDSKGNTLFEKVSQTTPILAQKSEYLCLGFPEKIIENLKTEIVFNLKKTPSAVSRIEQILIERLCCISIRKNWFIVSEGTIRQVFEIKRKALKNGQRKWPNLFQYK